MGSFPYAANLKTIEIKSEGSKDFVISYLTTLCFEGDIYRRVYSQEYLNFCATVENFSRKWFQIAKDNRKKHLEGPLLRPRFELGVLI
jgi:hypothetical protein